MSHDSICSPRNVAVIIPYYQRDPGILRRALDSVRGQELPDAVRVHVYLVDDGSPRAAAADLFDTDDVTLIKQANAGPGAARNTALDRLWTDGGADIVAFLDSDDIWHPDHLAHALDALDQGYDFYCCDNARPGDFALFSERTPVLAGGGARLAGRGTVIDADGPVRGFGARALCDEIAVDYISHTSTVVLRAPWVETLRFDTELRSAGEDRMFWLELGLAGARMAVSWRCNVTCGAGVNLFFSAHDWNSAATLEKFASQLLFSEKLLRLGDLSEARRQFAETRLSNCRRAYAFLFVRTLAKLRLPPVITLKRLLAYDPLLPFRMPGLFLGVVFDKRPPEQRLQAE
jgi:succinoglycan biosynthesis protein ExoW